MRFICHYNIKWTTNSEMMLAGQQDAHYVKTTFLRSFNTTIRS
jgi:hypothetical protein